MNWNLTKLRHLAQNAALPAGSSALVFWLAFGFGWWILPLSILIGSGTSLITTKPKNLILPEGKKNTSLSLALEEAKIDRELDRL